MLTVTEAGLYRLIFRSDKPEAERFRSWVFHEVLPELRRKGSYRMDDEMDALRTMYEQAKGTRVQFAIYADIQRLMRGRAASPAIAPVVAGGPFSLEKFGGCAEAGGGWHHGGLLSGDGNAARQRAGGGLV